MTNLTEWLVEPRDEPTMRDPVLLKTLFFDVVDPDAAERVLREHMCVLQSCVDQWTVHKVRLLAPDTPLLREQLLRRDKADHARISALTAHVFDYLVEAALLRMEWAERAICIVHVQLPDSAAGSASA